jgi:hypothetical protein
MLKLNRVAIHPHDGIRRLSHLVPLAIERLGATVPHGIFVLQDAVTADQFFIYGAIHE